MASESLKDRVAALEAEMALLKAKLDAANSGPPWWERIWGAFADDPAFEQAMRLGRQYRESQRPHSSRRPKKLT